MKHCVGAKELKRTFLAFLFSGSLALAQSALPTTPTIKTSARLVQVDLIATDEKGQPLSSLANTDVELSEDGHRQSLVTFSYHRASDLASAPPLAPGTFTNRDLGAAGSPPVILLLDALNTPLLDQAHARDQMLKYLQSQDTGHNTAIFALTDDLLLLQNFTTDSALLRKALEHRLPHPSPLLPDAQTNNIEIPGASDSLANNLQRFMDDEVAARTDVRVRITLDALEGIAKMVSGFPGRKTLVWVSGAFPLNLRGSAPSYWSSQRWYSEAIERTSNLLDDAHVAVYPVDARGLVGSAMSSVSFTGRSVNGRLLSGADLSREMTRQNLQIGSSQDAMEQLATDTGGKAYFNRNDIDRAVSLAAADGANYYELAYYPSNKKWDGRFRKIEIKVHSQKAHLNYRRGYFASDPLAVKKIPLETVRKEIDHAVVQPLLITQLTFFGSALPPNGSTNDVVGIKQIHVRFLLDPRNIGFEPLDDGVQHCDVFFYVGAFSGKRLVAQSGKNLDCKIKPANYSDFLSKGLAFDSPLELSSGSFRLRLLVRDNLTGHLGTLDVPYPQTSPSP